MEYFELLRGIMGSIETVALFGTDYSLSVQADANWSMANAVEVNR